MINNNNFIINYCLITDHTNALYSLISLKILVSVVITVYIEFYQSTNRIERKRRLD